MRMVSMALTRIKVSERLSKGDEEKDEGEEEDEDIMSRSLRAVRKTI